MQLSAVCAAATVSARPVRQTEEGCSLRLTLLTLGQHDATNKAEANKQHTTMFAMFCWPGWGNVAEITARYVVS